MAIRVIDDTKLNDIAVVIQQKSGMDEQMTVDEMPQRIADIPTHSNDVLNGLIDGSLTSIVINDITKIAAHAFSYNNRLISATFKNVINIKSSALSTCTALKFLDVPKIEVLGTNAIASCNVLTDIVLRKRVINQGNVLAIKTIVYVHQSDLEWYSTATNWSAYYEQGKITSIEDNIEYLVSLGYDRDELLEVSE